MRRGWATLTAVGFAACADPAAVEVRVSVEEPMVSAIALDVRVAGDEQIACRLPLDGAPEGVCPFSAGEGRWTRAGALSFVLYGEPDLPFEVDVSGERDGRSVTATAAQASLPSVAGERRVLELALLGRTRPRFQCDVVLSLGLEPPERVAEEGAQTALLVLPPSADARAARVSPLGLLTSSRNALTQVSYTKTPDGCVLEERPLIDKDLVGGGTPPLAEEQRWCNVRGGAMVARPVPGLGRTVLVAGLCANSSPGRLKLGVVRGGRTLDVLSEELPVAPQVVSDPVLADTDGDGMPEAAILIRGAGGAVSLGRMWLTETGPQTAITELTGVTVSSVRPFAPLVLPAGEDRREALLVVGHNGPMVVFRGGRAETVRTPRPSLRPPAAYFAGAGRFGVVTQPGLTQLAHLSIGLDAGAWRVDAEANAALPFAVAPSFDAALSLGRPSADGPLQVALLDDGYAYLAAVEPGLPVDRRDVFGGAASDAQLSRWANIDGVPGAELLAFDPDGSSLAAITLDGSTFDGWPLTLPSSGAPRRLVLADLDGPGGQTEDGLRDLEIVTLSDRVLTVVTLGPGSYDFEGMDWPAPRYAPHETGVWVGSRDPARTVLP